MDRMHFIHQSLPRGEVIMHFCMTGQHAEWLEEQEGMTMFRKFLISSFIKPEERSLHC